MVTNKISNTDENGSELEGLVEELRKLMQEATNPVNQLPMPAPRNEDKIIMNKLNRSGTILIRNKKMTDPYGIPSLYTGPVLQGGIPNGVGVCRYTSDFTQAYYGEWRNGTFVREGLFMVRAPQRYRYYGQWNDKGQIDGFGVQGRTDSKTLYCGQLKDGACSGYGILVMEDGKTVEGWFQKNLPHGYGTLYDTDGQTVVYEGSWEKGKISAGSASVGARTPSSFVRRMPFVDPWNLKCLFSGYVDSDGKPHGWGTTRYSMRTREAYYTMWNHGEAVGHGAYVWTSGKWYVGNWKGINTQGRGVTALPDGTVLAGDFQEGSTTGRGMIVYKDATSVYEGEVLKGKPHGQGEMYVVNGKTIYDGKWTSGTPIS